MIFGGIDINTTDPSVKWEEVSWKDFLKFYELNLKDKVNETPEEVGKALGVKVPKPKGGNA